jgi:hypothetical protein
MKNASSDSQSTWELRIPADTTGYLVSRSTILILCGLLAGVLLSFQLTTSQRTIVAGSCMIGIIAFLTLDGSISHRLLAQNRRLRETRDMLNRRIDLQVAFLDAQPRETAAVGNHGEGKSELIGSSMATASDVSGT